MRKGFRKLDNHGATLVFAIVTTVVILILASLILSLSVSNFRIKATDYKSRQEFYTAEVASNELYSGIATQAIRILGEAYEGTLETIVVHNLAGEIIYTDSSTLNTQFKESYMIGMMSYLFDTTIPKSMIFPRDGSGNLMYDATTPKFDFATNTATAGTTYEAYRTAMKGKLETFLSNQGATLSFQDSTGTLTEDPTMYFDYAKFALVIENVHIEYNDAEYQSSQTFDVEVQFPDWNLSVQVNQNHLGNPFKDYTLIGAKGVNIGDGVGIVVNANGGIYGGGTAKKADSDSVGGIRINSSKLVIAPYPGALVSNADIIVKAASGSGVAGTNVGIDLIASANDTSRNTIWCSNLIMKSSNSVNPDKPSSLDLNSGTYTYTADDLEIDADDCSVQIDGAYVGFGINKADSQDAYKSSAIIVNGKGAQLTASTSSNLFIAGRSYINVSRANGYTYKMGESVAVRADQKAYLVPADYLPTGATNPSLATGTDYSTMPATSFNIPTSIMTYLNAAKPVVSKKGRPSGTYDMYYYYLNFADDTKAKEFIVAAMGGAGEFAKFKSAVNSAVNNKGTATNDFMISINSAAKSTSGAVAGVSGASGAQSVSMANASATSTAIDVEHCLDYENKFFLRKCLLVDTESSAFRNADGSVKIVHDKCIPGDGNTYQGQDFARNPFTNYIKLSTLQSAGFRELGDTSTLAQATLASGSDVTARVYYRVMSPGTPFEITSAMVQSGSYLIVVVDGDVKVSTSFNGLVMASGTITLDQGVTINSAGEAIDKLLDQGYITKDGVDYRIGEVFWYYATKDSDGDDINTVGYSDVLEYSNWRKY